MKQLVVGLFEDSTSAGKLISELKNKGYAKEISLVSKDESTGKTTSHSVKEDPSVGATAGAVTGAAMGVFAGVLAGLATIASPAGAFIVGGPLFASWAAAGAAAGAVTGGIVGGLVDAGIPEEKAKLYEKQIQAGQVLVAVTADEGTDDEVAALMELYGVSDIVALQLAGHASL
jgi:uncharacterized membrane protein